ARAAYSSVLPFDEKEVLVREMSRQIPPPLSSSGGSRSVSPSPHVRRGRSFSHASVDFNCVSPMQCHLWVESVSSTIWDGSCSKDIPPCLLLPVMIPSAVLLFHGHVCR
ncbi:unnamed protein product, partial [Ectocarpus sp. 8 AP-2014]